jgi:primosomal protein N' (replication factor Y)
MATGRLRLKIQSQTARSEVASSNQPVARVWVNTGVLHLDESYDYLVPQSLDVTVKEGSRVSINFSGRIVEGFVIERLESAVVGNLKFIEKVISPIPLLTQESKALIDAAARKWGGSIFDLLTSAIPPRVVSVERQDFPIDHVIDKSSQKRPTHSYYLFAPGEDPYRTLMEWINVRGKLGAVLVVLPEVREVEVLSERLHEEKVAHSVLDASLPRAERYENYLNVAAGNSSVVIGTRSAIFAPIRNLQTIIIYREVSQSHYEVRSPGWNTREVAILRSQLSGIDLTFAGFSPSSECSLLIEEGFLGLTGRKGKVDTSAYPQIHGELLPDRIFSPIRKALEKGSVLFLVPRKGYAQSISCKSCKNIALCDCGGRLAFLGPGKGFRCSLCSKEIDSWSCAWCKKNEPILLGRGNLRFAQEIGRAFPGFRILSSDAENPIASVDEERSLVLATAGMVPIISGGYKAVVILEAESLFSQIDLRAQERARESIMHAISHTSVDGKALVVIDNSHPVVAAVARWNQSPLLMRELREREQTCLPPYVHSISIELATTDTAFFVNGIRSAVSQSRLPNGVRILGPIKLDGVNSRVVLTVPRKHGQVLIDFLSTYRRKRSASRKSIPSMRVDPYSIT